MSARQAARGRATLNSGPCSIDNPNRWAEPLPARLRNRRRCPCGCGSKTTHVGMANGAGLMSGCEWSVRKWVRDPRWRAGPALVEMARRRAARTAGGAQ